MSYEEKATLRNVALLESKAMTERHNTGFPPELQLFLPRGWRFFPVAERTKDQPLITAWTISASCDPQQLESWAITWPNSNWGTATDSAHFVLDIDPRRAGDLWLQRR